MKKIIILCMIFLFVLTSIIPNVICVQQNNQSKYTSVKPNISYQFLFGKVVASFPSSEGYANDNGEERVIHWDTNEMSHRAGKIKILTPITILFGGYNFRPAKININWDDFITYDVYIKNLFKGKDKTSSGWVDAEFTGFNILVMETGRREYP